MKLVDVLPPRFKCGDKVVFRDPKTYEVYGLPLGTVGEVVSERTYVSLHYNTSVVRNMIPVDEFDFFYTHEVVFPGRDSKMCFQEEQLEFAKDDKKECGPFALVFGGKTKGEEKCQLPHCSRTAKRF